jgi:hypothetical protein
MYAPRRSAVSRPLSIRLVAQGRSLLDVIRYASGFLKELPLQPLLVALMAALVLGAVPMMLTALYSVVRAVLDGCWHAMGLHRATAAITPTPQAIINQLELL